MAVCAACKAVIVFGGKKENGQTFCNRECWANGALIGPPTPESEARPEPSAASTPEPEPAPRPAASETKAPKKPTSKPRKPLTDEQVAARLAKSLAKSCRDLGAGQTVKVDLIVSSAGKVVTRSAPGAAAELRKCLLGGAGGARFPEGTTRTVSVKVSM